MKKIALTLALVLCLTVPALAEDMLEYEIGPGCVYSVPAAWTHVATDPLQHDMYWAEEGSETAFYELLYNRMDGMDVPEDSDFVTFIYDNTIGAMASLSTASEGFALHAAEPAERNGVAMMRCTGAYTLGGAEYAFDALVASPKEPLVLLVMLVGYDEDAAAQSAFFDTLVETIRFDVDAFAGGE